MPSEYPFAGSNARSFHIGEPHGHGLRGYPPKDVQARILTDQNARCVYCGCKFGTWIERRYKQVYLKLEWDHAVPFSYLQANPDDNWVAACHVCNGIKSDRMFREFEDAVEFIVSMRQRKGYRPAQWTQELEDAAQVLEPRIVSYVEYEWVKLKPRKIIRANDYARIRQMRFEFKEHRRW